MRAVASMAATHFRFVQWRVRSTVNPFFGGFFLFFSHSTHFSHMSEPILPISHLEILCVLAAVDETVADKVEVDLAVGDHAVGDLAVRDHAVGDHAVVDEPVGDHAVGDRAVADVTAGLSTGEHLTTAGRDTTARASLTPPIFAICRTPCFPCITGLFLCFSFRTERWNLMVSYRIGRSSGALRNEQTRK